MKRVAIVAAKRTAMGSFQGQFSSLSAPDLGAVAIQAALEQSTLSADQIDEVLMGNVISAGVGQAPARQAAIKAGIPSSIPCSTVNKVCGSGMKTIIMGMNAINAGTADIVVAGGMESMTNAPHVLPQSRSGFRFGNTELLDAMVHDGLWDSFHGKAMGEFAEATAEKYEFTREQQDQYAIESVNFAKNAIESGAFKEEIAPVTVKSRKGDTVYEEDEQPSKIKLEKIPTLRPAFKKDGTVTAASSSSISDGAAACILVSETKVEELNLTPLAWVTAHAGHAQEPEWFTTAPSFALKKLLLQTGINTEDVDLWEINEAFAVVTMSAIHELGLDRNKVNVNGGATALGHPIGCSGTRIVVTLIHALKQHQKKLGVASLCIGGGEATALSVELT